MARYCMQLSYNGAPFFGWQVQPEQPSVQETLETALSLLLKEKVAVTGCGRTDTGVHAREYFAHFDSDTTLSEADCAQLCFRLNSFLPKEIAIQRIYVVADDFHARYDATSRTYRYYVNVKKDPFVTDRSYYVGVPLDVAKMNEAAALLLGVHDFTSFSKVHTQVNNFICDVTEAEWRCEGSQLIFTISANRFLRNMVRAVVGTLLDVGRGKLTVEQFVEILEKKDRRCAGTSVPAHALFLENVRY